MPPCDRPLFHLLHPVYRKGMGCIRRSKQLAGILFGLHPAATDRHDYWDWVTLALRLAIHKHLEPGNRFLDVGCGSFAILSIYAFRRGAGSITAVDILPAIVVDAQRVLEHHQIKATVLQSDLDAALANEKFDRIAFNAPYIPWSWGHHQFGSPSCAGNEFEPARWSGGTDGTETIQRFLDRMPAVLLPGGTLLLGFNRYYVAEARVRAQARRSGLQLFDRVKLPFTGAVVHVLRLHS